MNGSSLIQETAESISDLLELQLPEAVSEEVILQLLEREVSRLLRGSGESFFTLMYRLDISEIKLHEALADTEHGVGKVAKLVFDRQMQKVQSRINNRNSSNSAEDDDLKW